jgi:hypothetical protein
MLTASTRGSAVNVATRDIMDSGKDLRRHIFPRCHVSSLPGNKLPVVARCTCFAKLVPPDGFPSHVSQLARQRASVNMRVCGKRGNERHHGLRQGLTATHFPLLTGFPPIGGLAESGRHWHAAAPGNPARALALRSCSKSSPNSTFGKATRLFAALLFPVESCESPERTRTSRTDQARSGSNCCHQRDWPRFPQSRG